MRAEALNSAGDRMGQSSTPGPQREARPEDSGEWIRAAVRQYERQLVAYAAHLVGDSERARDIVQEAFVRLCSQDRMKLEAHTAEWLFRVCRNLAIDVRRKEKRMNLLSQEQSDFLGSAEPEPGDSVERDDSFAAVTRVMKMLPKNQQEVIRLKFQHGLSYKEISTVTNLTVTNVGFLMHTGLKTLRERFGGSTGSRIAPVEDAEPNEA